jgi:hypothetical protein
VVKIDYPYDTATIFNDPSPIEDAADEMIGELLVVDYRYARFALDPRTGLFSMIRFASLFIQESGHSSIDYSHWRDSSWNGLAAIQNGLTPSVRKQRSVLFGPNTLDIQGKSPISLLIDEVCESPCNLSLGLLKGHLASDHPPFLHLSNREHSPVVVGRLLLLRVLHRIDFGR